MIYIDPPYNTGNDFIYPDNYSESLRTYLEYTGRSWRLSVDIIFANNKMYISRTTPAGPYV